MCSFRRQAETERSEFLLRSTAKSKPSEAGSIWRGRRKERMCSFRRQAETERSEFLLTNIRV